MKNSTLFKNAMILLCVSMLGIASASAALKVDTATVLSETFSKSLGNFTTVSLAGAETWAWNASGYAKVTGYVSNKNNANDDWMVSPAMNLSNATEAILSFQHVQRYGVDSMRYVKLYVTDTYFNGTIDTTKWTELSFKRAPGTNWTFVNSGDVSLKSYIGKSAVRFAFRYTSDSIKAGTWEVKNINVRGVVRDVIFSENFDKMTNGSVGTPGTANIAATINNYTQASGWVAENAYEAGKAVKLGGASALGTLKTPAINLSQDGGKFYVSFYVSKWNTDSTSVNILVNDIQAYKVTGVTTNLTWVGPFELTGGTSSTTIKFAGMAAKNSRIFLDSLIVTQQVPAVPSASVATTTFMAKAGSTQTKTLVVTGKNLTGDLTVALVNKSGSAFSTATTTLAKADLLAGVNLSVSYKPTAASADTATVTLSGGGLASDVVATITGAGYVTIPVTNLAALRAAYVADQSATKVYEITGEAVVNYLNASGNSKYIQDATGGALIYDTKGLITTTFVEGDAMTGLIGTLTEYGKVLEIIPLENVAVSSKNNSLVPVELTIAEAKANKERYESMLVCFKNLTPAAGTAANWGTAKANFNFVNGTDTIVCRTNYTGLDYMTAATAIPTAATNYVGFLLEYNGTLQFCPRRATDIGYTGATVLPTKVKEVSVEQVVYSSNGQLNVVAKRGQLIEVYSLTGMRLVRSIANDGLNTFSLNKNQVVLVKVDNTVSKIVL